MALQVDTAGRSTGDGDSWYARSPERVAADLGVDPVAGLTPVRAVELLTANGPNALPEEKPKPGWLRFLAAPRRRSWPGRPRPCPPARASRGMPACRPGAGAPGADGGPGAAGHGRRHPGS
jgi:hypothetical protein